MSVLKFFILFLTISQTISEPNSDLCGKYAILNLMDSFHIGQRVEKIINIDFENYEKLFTSLTAETDSLKTNMEKYDTNSEIEASEPDPLIKFTENFNLIKITADKTQNFNSKCRQKNAALITLEPFMIEELTRIMKLNRIERTPVSIIAIGGDIVSHTGSFLNVITDEARTLMDNNYKKLVGMLLVNGTVYFETDSVEETGLCFKHSNPWDMPGPTRNKFLTTTIKIAKVLPKIKEWTDSFNNFNRKAKQVLGLVTTNNEKYQLALPPQLTSVSNFISKYSKLLSWERTIPANLNDFLGFVTNMRDLIPTLSAKEVVSNAPSMEIQSVDGARLIAHLGIPPHFSVSGKLTLTPASGHKQIDDSLPVSVSALVFNTQEVASLYQVKPLIFERKMVDIQYVISWMQKSLSFTSLPSILNCHSGMSDPSEKSVKVCSSFQQAGSSLMNISDRTKCATALLSKVSTEDIKFCPVSLAQSSSVTAVRAECVGFSGKVAIVSANKPVKITVKCSETNERTLTYKMFPIKIQTECELRLVEGKSEKLLLPHISSGLAANENIKNGGLLIVTPSSTLTEDELRDIAIERNNTAIELLKEQNLSINDLFVRNLPYLAAGLSGFTMFSVFLFCICACFGRKKAMNGLWAFWSCFKFIFKCCKCCCKSCKKKKQDKRDNAFKIAIENIELGELSELLRARLEKPLAMDAANAPVDDAISLKSNNSALSSRAPSPSNNSARSASATPGKRVSHTYR